MRKKEKVQLFFWEGTFRFKENMYFGIQGRTGGPRSVTKVTWKNQEAGKLKRCLHPETVTFRCMDRRVKTELTMTERAG